MDWKSIPPARYISVAWEERPLALILWLALLFRLLAAFFARGWGMLDDHFLVIEAPQSWVFGYDYNRWLPGSTGNTGPSGHNFFYPGLHYFLFLGMRAIGLDDPQFKMLIVRIIHAAWSMVTVWAGYRITEKLSGTRPARLAGILLALYFFFPWTGVRNLVESTCIPFLMLGFHRLILHGNRSKAGIVGLQAGLLFGMAMNLRYQTALFPVGVMTVLLLRREWKEALALGAGTAIAFLGVQAAIDLAIWGRPFAEVAGYVTVNVVDRHSYFNLPWYNYFLTVGGMLLPPVSLLLFWGFFRGWKDQLLLFLPAAFFFLFHSAFPNKQERFILPFIPFFIMAGVMGYHRYVKGSRLFVARPGLLRGTWIFFWIINGILLGGLTFMYSKKSRAETMYYLYRYPDVRTIILEDETGNVPLLPIFYTGQWPRFPEKEPGDSTIYQQVERFAARPRSAHPQFFIFTGEKNLKERVARARASFPGLVYETTIEPAFIDRFMHRLNPVNRAERFTIYRNTDFYKTKIE